MEAKSAQLGAEERQSSTVHRIRRGFDIPLAGEPRQQVDVAHPVTHVALLGRDYVSLRPRLVVAEGEQVLRGQALWADRHEPAIRFTSPGAGRVVAVNRGERRALRSVVIELDRTDSDPDADAPQVEWKTFRATEVSEGHGDQLEALLLESGLWTALRTRPFGRLPKPGTVPQSIFVTALDTNPHAPDLDVVLEGHHGDFAAGLTLLAKVGRGGPVRLCVRQGSALSALEAEGVTVHRFAGPHPAGLPGVHINHIEPVSRDRLCWYVGAQDVVAMGHLVRTGKLLLRRTIALGGAPVTKPRLLRTRLGAAIGELLQGEVDTVDHRRFISGSVLHGHDATTGDLAFLGRYHQQISVVSDERKRQFLGWMAPKLKETLYLDALLSKLVPQRRLSLNTQMHGERRPLIPIGRYERYLPHKDIVAPLLFRALLTQDLDKAEALGALELEEEDLALCSFVCPSKIHFGRHLREVLTELEKEGA